MTADTPGTTPASSQRKPLFIRLVDWIDERLWPWAQWADGHRIPEMFWGLREFWYYMGNPRRLWWQLLAARDFLFAPQKECIDNIDGYCVGYHDTPSRFMWGLFHVRSWIDPRYLYYRWKGWL